MTSPCPGEMDGMDTDLGSHGADLKTDACRQIVHQFDGGSKPVRRMTGCIGSPGDLPHQNKGLILDTEAVGGLHGEGQTNKRLQGALCRPMQQERMIERSGQIGGCCHRQEQSARDVKAVSMYHARRVVDGAAGPEDMTVGQPVMSQASVPVGQRHDEMSSAVRVLFDSLRRQGGYSQIHIKSAGAHRPVQGSHEMPMRERPAHGAIPAPPRSVRQTSP